MTIIDTAAGLWAMLLAALLVHHLISNYRRVRRGVALILFDCGTVLQLLGRDNSPKRVAQFRTERKLLAAKFDAPFTWHEDWRN